MQWSSGTEKDVTVLKQSNSGARPVFVSNAANTRCCQSPEITARHREIPSPILSSAQSEWHDRLAVTRSQVTLELSGTKRRAASERSRSMSRNTRFVGMDVHAQTITVAVAEGRGEVRSLGTIQK